MAKINYYDGTKFIEFEVSDSVAHAYAKISKDERRECWRNRKRPPLSSIDQMRELGIEVSSDYDILLQYIKNEQIELLKKAIVALPRKHRKLIKMVFFDNVSQTEIAQQEGVSKSAIKCRLNLIFDEIKNLMGGFDD